MQNFSLSPRIQDRAECGKGPELTFGEDTAQKKSIPGGGTLHIFSEQGDTAHQNRLPVVIGSVRKRWAVCGGWRVSGGWFPQNNATAWLHLAS